ncbi:hypothetical protein F511_25420 [Dorcoceras hygrometricum]|uniref:Uncharacterized protein n=1 Tax=Dorcoceras hygrometricum TaxID=472368 RepID=A0A2Z7BVR3_9LAMI|nr:hypothetical protein F511_25420 [Dorcoceras hygrometricum]
MSSRCFTMNVQQLVRYVNDQQMSPFKKKKKCSWSWSEVADDEDQLERKLLMTSAVTSSFSRSYSVQQMKIQQMKRSASFGMSRDDISLDVITISRRSGARKQQYFQSRAYLYQLLLRIQSLGNPVARREEAGEVKRFNQSQDSVAIFQQKRERSSSRLNSAGTNYEELRELDVNC